jgi:hypothetical protein
VKGKSQPETMIYSQQCVGFRFQFSLHPLLGFKGLGEYGSSKVDILGIYKPAKSDSINSIGSV